MRDTDTLSHELDVDMPSGVVVSIEDVNDALARVDDDGVGYRIVLDDKPDANSALEGRVAYIQSDVSKKDDDDIEAERLEKERKEKLFKDAQLQGAKRKMEVLQRARQQQVRQQIQANADFEAEEKAKAILDAARKAKSSKQKSKDKDDGLSF